jgi:FAD/FMN-containing dehydrogenase
MTETRLDESALSGSTNVVLHAGSPEYEQARHLWNAMIDRRPSVIVQPEHTQDVAAAVRFARANGLLVAVKGGGHSAPGYSMCDDGVVIDLVRMQAVSVDPSSKLATVQGGALLGALDQATAPHRLVVPASAISHTGAGGLTLGGGFGHLMRKFGLTIDSLVGAEVVLADGEITHVDAYCDPDLFWALRGGSGNFGVVTEFHFRCHDFGPDIYVSANVFGLEHARPALHLWRELMEQAPNELGWNAFFRGAPDATGFEWIPKRLQDKPVLLMPLMWAGDPAEGQARIEELTARLDNIAAQVCGVVPFVEVQQQWDEVFAHGRRHYAKAGFLGELPDSLLDVVLEATANLPDPNTQIEILRLGGAVAEVGADETAFPHRDANWPFNIIGLWDDPMGDAKAIEWVRKLYADLEPNMSGGTYVNYASGDEAGGTRAAYGQTWERLVDLKEKYDPENLFRFNANLTRGA